MPNNWYDEETIKKQIAAIVEKEVKQSLKSIPEHLAGNKFTVPPAMAEWMDAEYASKGGQCDFYFRAAVGYGPAAIMVDWAFSKNGITMTFLSPFGDRLFMLDLIK